MERRQQDWIAEQVDRALPVSYSHLASVLPVEPRNLGARVGITIVLYTWTQSLHYYPHPMVKAGARRKNGQR